MSHMSLSYQKKDGRVTLTQATLGTFSRNAAQLSIYSPLIWLELVVNEHLFFENKPGPYGTHYSKKRYKFQIEIPYIKPPFSHISNKN